MIEAVDLNADEDSNVAPVTQHANEIDKAVGARPSFDPGTERIHAQYYLMNDLGIYARNEDDEIQHVHRLDDEKYRQLIQSLNKEQKNSSIMCYI